MSPATTISENSQPLLFSATELKSMRSVADSRAKVYQLLAASLAYQIREALFGANTRDCFTRYDHSSASWKTPQTSLIWGWQTFSGTWPRSGMMRGGIAYQLGTLAPRKFVTESGLSGGLFPAPAERDYRFPNKKPYSERGGGRKGEQLPNVVGGPLNPYWVEALMGFPLGWTDATS